MITNVTTNMCGTLTPDGKRADVGAAGLLREAIGQECVVHRRQAHHQPERGQDAAEHERVRHLEHEAQQAGQHQHVDENVGAETEECVPVARRPDSTPGPDNRTILRGSQTIAGHGAPPQNCGLVSGPLCAISRARAREMAQQREARCSGPILEVNDRAGAYASRGGSEREAKASVADDDVLMGVRERARDAGCSAGGAGENLRTQAARR